MSTVLWVLVAFVAAYAAIVLGLIAAGQRTQARAWAGFIPDCIVLVKRLLGDPRVPHRRKLLLGAFILYLALPFDLVPDFIPVAGQLDDAILLALVLGLALRGGGQPLLAEHWPGPPESLRVVQRLAFPRAADSGPPAPESP